MREQALQYIRKRKLLRAGDRVAVAVSGGADSVALLRALLELREELGVVLAVSHFNHQLRGDESDADEQFVAQLAHQHDLPFFAGRGKVREHAAAGKLSLEHAARELRYEWLVTLAREERFDAIATAHTADDQAETVLMKFLRGAGTRGLAGIHPVLKRGDVRMVRPLLETTRAEVEQYLASLCQPWREDHSNCDRRLTRNRIRHDLLPLLERDYNPNLHTLLSETAEVARSEEDHWRAAVEPELTARHPRPNIISITGFDHLDVALQRRLLKSFLESEGIAADFHHVEALRHCALADGSCVNLPGGWLAVRNADCLTLTQPNAIGLVKAYEYKLAVPGEIHIAEIGAVVRASLLPPDSALHSGPGSLLRADGLGPELLVRNRRPGDRFRPAHSGSEEKLKRLFSEKHIPAHQRPLWPVALSGSQIVWVRGLPPAHDFVWTPGCGEAIRIEALADK